MFRLVMLAILLHDTGYLKTKDDLEGTGAKYTITHVARSAEFARQFLSEKGFGPGEIQSVQNMISCTGVTARMGAIPFHSELERVLGASLATADLVGQMAADDYVDKLPVLYAEFAEAVQFSGDRQHFVASFSDASDLIVKTPLFWEKLVKPKLEKDFGGLYRFLSDPFPDGPNHYVERILQNMERLKQQTAMATNSTAAN
jgi:hypothetical protein